MLTKNDLQELGRTEGDVLASIYLPTHRRAVDAKGDPIRLKNALSEAVERGAERGVERKHMQALLAPAEQLLGDEWFWQHQDEGLALFLDSHGMRDFRLAHPVDDLVIVDRRFCLRPLLPAVRAGDQYYVLALSQNRVRLVRCSRTGGRELDLRDIPGSLADAVGYDVEQESLQFHSGAPRGGGGRPAAIFHGHGGAADSGKVELAKFLRRVDDGIVKLLGAMEAPLVIAAVKFEATAYREGSRYGALAARDLEGNPDRLSARELAEATWPLVEAQLDTTHREALAAVEAGLAAGRVVTDIETALRDLRAGRIGTLLVRTGVPLWGSHDEATGAVEQHERRQPNDDDLLDLCVAGALQTGATVQAVPASAMPGGGPLAGARRF